MVGECVRFLFMSCEESRAQRTSEFAILHNESITENRTSEPAMTLFVYCISTEISFKQQ